MDMEDFWVMWIWGFCGIPTGSSVGMGWMWALKSSSHGMQPCRLALLDEKQDNGSDPDTPCTMDSSRLGARRRLAHDATNTTQKGR